MFLGGYIFYSEKCSPDKKITDRETDKQTGKEAGGRQRKTKTDRCMLARLTNRQADSPTNGRTV